MSLKHVKQKVAEPQIVFWFPDRPIWQLVPCCVPTYQLFQQADMSTNLFHYRGLIKWWHVHAIQSSRIFGLSLRSGSCTCFKHVETCWFLKRGNFLEVASCGSFAQSCKFVCFAIFPFFCLLPFSSLAFPEGNRMPGEAHLSFHLSVWTKGK